MTMIAIDNPVMQAEFKHQRRVITTSRSGWFWIGPAMLMLVPALCLSLTGCPRVWGHSSSGGSTSGGVVVDVPF